MNEATQDVAPSHASEVGEGSGSSRLRVRRSEAEAAVWPARVVVGGVLGEDVLEVTPTELEREGTETLITPATCPFMNRCLYGPRTTTGARALPGTPQRLVLESQTLKSSIASLALDPMWNQSTSFAKGTWL